MWDKVKISFVLIILSYTSVNAQFNNNWFKEQDSCLLCEKFFVYTNVSIEPSFEESIDSIISNYKMIEGLYWYLDFTTLDEYRNFTLSMTDVETFTLFNKEMGFENKLLILNDKIVLIRANKTFEILSQNDMWVVLKNPCKVEVVSFCDYSYWVFSLQDNYIKFINRVIW